MKTKFAIILTLLFNAAMFSRAIPIPFLADTAKRATKKAAVKRNAKNYKASNAIQPTAALKKSVPPKRYKANKSGNEPAGARQPEASTPTPNTLPSTPAQAPSTPSVKH